MKVYTSQVSGKDGLALVTADGHQWSQGPKGQEKVQRSLNVTL